MRTLALVTGLFGVVVAFVINLFYSFLHVLGRVTGITNDQSHFFWGLFVILIGLIGSLFALFIPTVGVVLLAYRYSREQQRVVVRKGDQAFT
jgi:predicted membrane protein